MKKTILLPVILLGALMLSSFNTQKIEPALTGIWNTTDKDIGIKLEFDKEGFVTISQGPQTLGGRKFKKGSMYASMTYEVNNSTSPRQIDFILTNLEDGKTERQPGIYELTSPKKLTIAFDDDGIVRPKSFENKTKGNTLILDKTE